MLEDKLKKYNIILASQSPRRQNLLRGMGIKFRLSAFNNQDELFPPELDKFQIPVYLAEKKSGAFGKLDPGDLLITADTIVWLNDHVLGKPSDYKDAIAMLNELSGKLHEVITGVCLRTDSQSHSFYDHTEVSFSELSPEEIEHYIKKWKPYDKARAYGIQEWIGYIGIRKITGCFFNVMGLPTARLYRELENF